MSATAAPYRSTLPAGRDGFAPLLRAEWTKFRSVRGWLITAIASALLIVGFAYLGTFAHHDGGICFGPNPSSGTCRSFLHPTPPIGPGGLAVTDTYYSVHRALTGDGSITVLVSSLTGRIQGGGGNSASVADMAGAPGPLQPWAKAGLILSAATKPGSPYVAVMLTGAHGVRMQFDYFHDIAGPAAASDSPRWLRLSRSGTTVTAYESADGRSWTRVGSARVPGWPRNVQGGLFVTSPQTAPPGQALEPGAGGVATGAAATFGAPGLQGGWSRGAWTASDVGDDGSIPTLSSQSARRGPDLDLAPVSRSRGPGTSGHRSPPATPTGTR